MKIMVYTEQKSMRLKEKPVNEFIYALACFATNREINSSKPLPKIFLNTEKYDGLRNYQICNNKLS